MFDFMKPFHQLSIWILKFVSEEKLNRNAGNLEQDLAALSPGKKQMGIKEYFAKRMSIFFIIIFWGAGISLFTEIILAREADQLENNKIGRPGYGEGTRETELGVYLEGKSEQAVISVQVQERKYTAAQIEDKFDKLMKNLDSIILGENESLDEVRTNLILPETLENGVVKTEWFLSPDYIINSRGEFINVPEQKGELIELRAVMKCQGQEAECSLYAHVYPPLQTQEEAYLSSIQMEIEKADASSVTEPDLTLPAVVDGKAVRWTKQKSPAGMILSVIFLAAAVGSFVGDRQKINKRIAWRKRQMIIDYPELLLKISMLLGAGLTINRAVTKLALEYRDRREKEEHYAYEELLAAYYEIQTGVSQTNAYEHFGERCQVACYRKLGSLLSQNIKKGSEGLIEQLETEMIVGMEERKKEAKRLGEEAGTKLLMPMILMLIVVLIILMVPAVLSF